MYVSSQVLKQKLNNGPKVPTDTCAWHWQQVIFKPMLLLLLREQILNTWAVRGACFPPHVSLHPTWVDWQCPNLENHVFFVPALSLSAKWWEKMESLNLQGREVKTERLCDCIEARLRGSVGVKSTLEKMSFTFGFCDFHVRGVYFSRCKTHLYNTLRNLLTIWKVCSPVVNVETSFAIYTAIAKTQATADVSPVLYFQQCSQVWKTGSPPGCPEGAS